MKLIIDIPEENYKFIKDLQFYNSGRRSGRTIERNVINGIKNGKSYEERPHGEWIDYSSRTLTCSNCKKNIPNFETYIKMNFCPNCGAEMRGGKEE